MYSDVSEGHDTILIGWLVIKWSSLIYRPLKMKKLSFFEILGCIKLPATQCNVSEDQNSKYCRYGDVKSRDSSFVNSHQTSDALLCCSFKRNQFALS